MYLIKAINSDVLYVKYEKGEMFYENKEKATVFKTKEEAEKLIVGYDFLRVIERTTEISFTDDELKFLDTFLGNYPGFPHHLYVKFANNSVMSSNLSSYKNSSIFLLYLTECLGIAND